MLLGACRRAAALGDTDRLIAAGLANNRGTFSTVSTIDEEKVAMLETALDRGPPTTSAGPNSWPPSVPSSPWAARSSVVKRSPTKRSASRAGWVTTNRLSG